MEDTHEDEDVESEPRPSVSHHKVGPEAVATSLDHKAEQPEG